MLIMKRLKFLIVFVFLLVGTLTVMAFTNNNYRKQAVIMQCLKYTGPVPARPIYIVNFSNWTSFGGGVHNLCPDGWELCAICFDTFDTTQGQALQMVADHYREYGTLPSHGSTITNYMGSYVTVYLNERMP